MVFTRKNWWISHSDLFHRSCQVWILQPSGTSGAVDSYPWIDNFFPTIDVDNLDCNHCVVPGRFSSNWDYRQKPFVCRRAKYPALIWRFVEIDVYHDSAIDSGYMGWQYRPVCNWSNSLCEWKCVFPLLYLFCSFHRHWCLCLLESHYGHHCGDGLLDFFGWLQFTSKGTGNGQKERDWKSDSVLRLKRKKQQIQKDFGFYTQMRQPLPNFRFLGSMSNFGGVEGITRVGLKHRIWIPHWCITWKGSISSPWKSVGFSSRPGRKWTREVRIP